MAKMFAAIQSFMDGRRVSGATRTGEREMRAEINNIGHHAGDQGGRTTVEAVLFEDGSGKFTVDRKGGGRCELWWTSDEANLRVVAHKEDAPTDVEVWVSHD